MYYKQGEGVQGRIHSLKGEFDEVFIISWKDNNNIIVWYKGWACTAIYNPLAGCLYVDDIYGKIPFDKHERV